ncbi:MAG: DNA repair protein RecN [Marinicellaceae bacterium]
MIQSLFIKNYVLIRQLELDFSNGFHAFTGETGAGKSIIVGALSLILGNRADYSVIRDKNKKCEISAVFDISHNKLAQKWLLDQDIEHTNEIECRRVISADGRSKSWLNTRPCTNASLKKLGSYLVQIHGQHDQIKLNNSKYQLTVIDETGQYQKSLQDVAELSMKWHKINSELTEIELAGALNESESQLLQYQYEELEQLNLTETEIDELHIEQKSLTHAVETISNIQQSMGILSGDGNVSESITHITQHLNEVQGIDFKEVLTMLDEISINLNEIEAQLQTQQDTIEVNPEKLNKIENRLEQIYSTARKHNVTAENLYQHQQTLGEKLQLNDSQKQKRSTLLEEKNKTEKLYLKQATSLSNSRKETAEKFQKQVTQIIQKLGLGNAQFLVNIQHNPEALIHKSGQDTCDFEVIMNAGQAPQKMSATASGGELSRIALGVEICKKQDKQSSSFVFDEVDAGIGGAVAETVGKLMRKLSHNQQVFAVTHLPHVAGLSHQHYLVSKKEINGLTESSVKLLNEEQRINELARMSGGSTITETTLEQAKEFMLGV